MCAAPLLFLWLLPLALAPCEQLVLIASRAPVQRAVTAPIARPPAFDLAGVVLPPQRPVERALPSWSHVAAQRRGSSVARFPLAWGSSLLVASAFGVGAALYLRGLQGLWSPFQGAASVPPQFQCLSVWGGWRREQMKPLKPHQKPKPINEPCHCPLCGHRFPDAFTLAVHRRYVHGMAPPRRRKQHATTRPPDPFASNPGPGGLFPDPTSGHRYHQFPIK
eukprot:GGOE01000043.1.p1 GENE.GGOE01000043.1~~GGOE01000043.1.p1  ORF type:complete len:259 (+),score=19.34 GGOE01000043.1:117-779(+)